MSQHRKDGKQRGIVLREVKGRKLGWGRGQEHNGRRTVVWREMVKQAGARSQMILGHGGELLFLFHIFKKRTTLEFKLREMQDLISKIMQVTLWRMDWGWEPRTEPGSHPSCSVLVSWSRLVEIKMERSRWT